MRFSRTLAIIFGILLPLVETIRRWGTWQAHPPALFDDYLIGAFLLFGAWSARGDSMRGRGILAAAWGFTRGLGYASFFGQLWQLDEPDPSGFPVACVVAIKGVGLTLAIIALILTVRAIAPGSIDREAR